MFDAAKLQHHGQGHKEYSWKDSISSIASIDRLFHLHLAKTWSQTIKQWFYLGRTFLLPYLCTPNAKNKFMEIRQLRYFINAATTLSFTEAANLSHVAQSTLSQQVKQLEEELGVPLFHRVGRRVELTTEGTLFLHDASRLLDDERQALQRLADLNRLEGGTVTVGIASGLGLSALLTDALTEYNKLYPHVEIRIRQLAGPLLPNCLRNHDIDIALTFSSDEERDLTMRPLFATRLCAVVGEHHALSRRSAVTLQQIAMQPLVLPSPNLSVRQKLDGMVRQQGLDLHPAVEVDDIPHIIYMVRLGHWTTVLPDASVMAVRGIVRIPLEEAILMPTHILTLADAYQRKAVTEFLRILDESSRLLLQTANEDCDVCGESFLE